MKKHFLILSAFGFLAFGCNESEGVTDKTEREEDDQFLETLYQEIVSLSESVNCEDPEEWEFTAIGHKACGGPTGYFAYPTSINVEDFLDQVAFYSEQQQKYNEKWGIISTCDIPPEPADVVCEDGKPVLTFSD